MTRVRNMTAADLPAVGVLAGKLVRLHHEFDPLRYMMPEDPERGYMRFFGGELERDGAILLVAEEDESVVGYAYACMEPRNLNELLDPCTKLHDIYVDERARHHGVGEALVRQVLREASARGAPRVLLLTAVQNERAQRLFERVGFRRTMLEMTCELGVDDGPSGER